MYDTLKEYLCTEDITTTQKLSERKLADLFDVKRSVVRECMLRLEGEGVLRREPMKGYFLEAYPDEEPNEIKTFRYLVEVFAIGRATRYADRENIVRLTLILEEMQEAVANHEYAALAKLDHQFHSEIIKASKSKLLKRIFDILSFPAVFRQVETSDSLNTWRGHARMLKAIKTGDTVDAQSAISEHIGGNRINIPKFNPEISKFSPKTQL